MSENIYNFSAGPATLPKSVTNHLKLVINNFDQGMSLLEVSHRSKAFKDFASESETTFRRLLNINDEYEVLFLQGGATHQFTMIPQNLSRNGPVDYLITGGWSKKAANYAAQQQIEVNIVSDSSDNNYTDVDKQDSWNINSDSDYFYYCANETVHGVEIHNPINIDTPLVCDMSSTLCTRPIEVSDFDVIFAGAQKNLGIAGLTIVIIKKELIKQKAEHLNPIMRIMQKINQCLIHHQFLHGMQPGLYLIGLKNKVVLKLWLKSIKQSLSFSMNILIILIFIKTLFQKNIDHGLISHSF